VGHQHHQGRFGEVEDLYGSREAERIGWYRVSILPIAATKASLLVPFDSSCSLGCRFDSYTVHLYHQRLKCGLITRYNFRKLCRGRVAALMTRDSKPIDSRVVFLHAEGRPLSVSRGGPRGPSSGRSSCRLPQPIRRCATGQANIRARWRRCR
jgi:hypothetical protein